MKRLTFSLSMAAPLHAWAKREAQARGLTLSAFFAMLVDEARKR